MSWDAEHMHREPGTAVHTAALPDVRAGTRSEKWENHLCKDAEKCPVLSLLSATVCAEYKYTLWGFSVLEPKSCSWEQPVWNAFPSVFLRWAWRNSCFIQKTYWGLLHRNYSQQRRIKAIYWLQFSLVLPIKDGSTFQQRLWCQTLLFLLMHSSFCRLTGLQELFESLIPQCFTCNKS